MFKFICDMIYFFCQFDWMICIFNSLLNTHASAKRIDFQQLVSEPLVEFFMFNKINFEYDSILAC